MLKLEWRGVADGDVTGWVEGSLRSHTERCAYDPALADRQDRSHLHQARLHPVTNRWAFFPDLGCDKVSLSLSLSLSLSSLSLYL